MKDYFKPLLSLTQTRKFWMGLATAVVAYSLLRFGATPEVVLLEGVLGSLGIFVAPNASS